MQADDGVRAGSWVCRQRGRLRGRNRSATPSANQGIATSGCPISPSRHGGIPNRSRAEAAQFTAKVPPQTSQVAAPHPLNDPFGDGPVPEPILPTVQDLLAGDTNKKLPADDLLPPPSVDSLIAPKDTPGLPSVDSMESSEAPKLPTTEEYIAGNLKDRAQDCKNPDDILYSIEELDHKTGIRDTSIANPDNRPRTCDLAGGDFVPRQWAPTTFMWQASGLCHKPAYFEDVHLERYGHSWGPYVQPLMSGAHFFLNVPILPYKMGLYPPNECIYTLGYYRPGSCAPYMLDPLPLSVRAGLAQAGAVVGMAYLLP